MQTKNKQYTLLTIVVAPANFTANLGFACAQLNTNGEYWHFNFSHDGNVNEYALSYLYPGNQGLKRQEYLMIEHLLHQRYDAVNFLIPDPREILQNWQYWRDIFLAVPANILQRSYIVPYAEYFKVEHILIALDELAYGHASPSVSSLPFTEIPKTDGEVWMFNQRCNQASRDFRADGSIK